MTDRKQEVIIEEIIGGFFNAIRLEKDTFPRVASESTFRDIATNLYRRLAPLIRGELVESLNRVIEGWCLDAEDAKDEVATHTLYECAKELERWLDNFKRLWEGQPQRVGDNILEQDKPKGTCQMCGGIGIGNEMSMPRPEDAIVCPQCGGTGKERRSGEERRRVKAHIVSNLQSPISESGINPKVFLSGLEKGGLVEIWKTDRRLLKDRRKC